MKALRATCNDHGSRPRVRRDRRRLCADPRGRRGQRREGEIQRVLTEHGADDPLMLGELRRFLPFTYVLVPKMRARFDEEDLGPSHRRNRDVARILVDLREGRTPDWAALPTPAETFTALPLPWSVELAARADAADRKEGQLLADFLLEVVGEPARHRLHTLAERDVTTAESTRRLLAAVPVPPTAHVDIRVLGPLEVLRDSAPASPKDVARRRVPRAPEPPRAEGRDHEGGRSGRPLARPRRTPLEQQPAHHPESSAAAPRSGAAAG